MKYLFLPALALLYTFTAQAGSRCAEDRRVRAMPQARVTLATPEEGWYDVQQVKLDLSLTAASTAISGNATTTAQVTAATLPVYAFELDTALIIDSFQLNGQTLPVTTVGATVRKVTLPTALAAGATFTARTFYHGQPASGTGFFTRGLNQSVLPSGTAITFTLSDMYLAKDWWPCKQDIRDKVDSVAVWITAPAGLKGCSNGILTGTTALSGGRTRYEWKHRFPVKYYLITAAVAPYTERSYTVHFANGDTLRIQNFVYDTAGIDASTRLGLDSLGRGVALFSQLFGRYPFWQEKYGNCMAPLGGGMEHQTMTTLGYNVGESTAMHELSHQWWGDCVSQGTWRDIWLSEGFATYCEQLYAENIYGTAAAQTLRTQVFNSVLTSPSGTVAVSDTTNANRVFDYRLTYCKGAAVVHMLRKLAPDDSSFFRACRQYQQQYRYRNATTADLQAVFQTVYNRPLDTFFQQWVYGQGYPVYSVRWNWKNGIAYVELTQTVSLTASVSQFSTPLELKLQDAGGSVLISVYNNSPVQLITLPFVGPLTSVQVDPNRNTLLKTVGLSTYDSTLGLRAPHPGGKSLQAYPNPTRTAWTVTGFGIGASLQLTDEAGHIVWRDRAAADMVTIPAGNLPPATYVLTANSDARSSLLLVRE